MVADSPSHITVIHNQKYTDSVMKAKQWLDEGRIGVADRTNHRATIVDFHYPAAHHWPRRSGMMLPMLLDVLEGCEDIAIGQASKAMRHAVAAEASECSCLTWLQWICKVENYRPVCIMIIGKQHAAGWHLVFSVMCVYTPLVGGLAGHNPAVVRRGRIGIDDEDEVISFAGTIANPYKKMFFSLALGVGLAGYDECHHGSQNHEK